MHIWKKNYYTTRVTYAVDHLWIPVTLLFLFPWSSCFQKFVIHCSKVILTYILRVFHSCVVLNWFVTFFQIISVIPLKIKTNTLFWIYYFRRKYNACYRYQNSNSSKNSIPQWNGSCWPHRHWVLWRICICCHRQPIHERERTSGCISQLFIVTANGGKIQYYRWIIFLTKHKTYTVLLFIGEQELPNK